MGSILGSSTRILTDGKSQPRPARATPHLWPRATRYAVAVSPQPVVKCSAYSSHNGLRSPPSNTLGTTPRGVPTGSPFGATPSHPADSSVPPARSGPVRARALRTNVVAAAAASVAPSLCPSPHSAPYRRNARRRATRVLPLPLPLPLAPTLPLPQPSLPPRATAAESQGAPEEEESQVVVYALENGISVTVRKIRTLDELRQVATLRADAYYENNQSRFVGSLKKKFVEQEVESLQQRTTIMSRNGKPYSECMVAVDTDSGAVLACIDMRLPAALSGTHPHGVPENDPHGCYLLNVVVREDVRGQGLGRSVMRSAMGRAVRLWGARQLYTHVEADNEVALRLYTGCGFAQHSLDARYEAASKLGQTLLLQAPASAAQEAEQAEQAAAAEGAAAA